MQCFVFQELCEQVFSERVNVDSSNIISNDFVDHKSEENETLIATAKEDNSQGCIKLLEMYIIRKLKLLHIKTYFCVLIHLNSIFFIQFIRSIQFYSLFNFQYYLFWIEMQKERQG